MDYMEMEFPGDARDAQLRGGRNMSTVEQWLSVATAVGLTAYGAYGVSKRRRSGWVVAGLGALMFRRGLSGYCHTYELLGINTAGTGQDTRRALRGSSGIVVDESL